MGESEVVGRQIDWDVCHTHLAAMNRGEGNIVSKPNAPA